MRIKAQGREIRRAAVTTFSPPKPLADRIGTQEPPMLDKQILADAATAAAKMSPVATAAVVAPSLTAAAQIAMYLLGSIYLVQQIAYLAWKKRRESKMAPKVDE